MEQPGTVAYNIFNLLAAGTTLRKKLKRAYFPVQYDKPIEPTKVEPILDVRLTIYLAQPVQQVSILG